MNFGEKLAELRTSKGWRQEDLAVRLYVTKQAVSKWETDRSFPEVTLIPKIADLLGTSVNELLVEKEMQNNDGKFSKTNEVIAEKANTLAYLFGLAICAFLLIIYFVLTPKINGTGILHIVLVSTMVAVLLFVMIKNILTPPVVIVFNGNELEIYNKANEIRKVQFDEINSVLTSYRSGGYAGKLIINLKSEESIVYHSIKKPAIVKGKIDALKNFLSNTDN